jgi:Phage tail lysozyme
MPTVELLIGGSPRRVEISEGATADDIEEIASSLGGPAAPSPAPAAREPETALGRAGSYVMKRGEEFVGAGQSLLADVAGAITGRDLIPGERGTLERVADIATVAAPIVAPGVTAAGLATGAAARAAGVEEPTAEWIDIGTQLATGGLGAARGAWKGLRGTQKAAVAAGERVQQAVPAAERVATKGFQARTYDKIASYAADKGLGIVPGTPKAEKFGQALLDAEQQWGPLAGTAEHRQVTRVLDKLTTPAAGPISYGELDDSLKALQKVRGPSSVRAAIDTAMQDALEGTPAAAARVAAQAEYRAAIRPMQKAAATIAKAPSPGAALRTVMRIWDDYPAATQKALDPTGEIAGIIKQARRMKPTGGGLGVALPGAGVAGAAYPAYQQFAEGDILGGVQALAAGAGLGAAIRYPGQAVAAVKGAVPPAVRAGVAVTGPALRAVTEGTAESQPAPSPAAETAAVSPAPEPRPTAAAPAAAPPPTEPAAPRATAPAGAPFARELAAVGRVVGVDPGVFGSVIPDPSEMQLMPGIFKRYQSRIESLTGRAANINDPLDQIVGSMLHVKDDLEASGGDVEKARGRYLAARKYEATRRSGPGGVAPINFMQGMVQRGWSPQEAAAAAGNVQVESVFRPGIQELKPLAGRGGYGLIQWTGPRRRALERYAATTGRNIADPHVQMDWLAMERSGESTRYGGPDERASFQRAFARGGSPEDIAHRFGRFVERPANLGATAAKRRAAAARYARLYDWTTTRA